MLHVNRMKPSMKKATASVHRMGFALNLPTTSPFIAPTAKPASMPSTSATGSPNGNAATVMMPEKAMMAGADRSAMLPEYVTNAMPDATLTLAVLGPFVSSPVEIRNVPNLRLKESDRIASLENELTRLGARVETFDDGLRVHPGPLKGARVETYNDHRVAMAFAVAGLAVPGVSIDDPGCVSKSFPDFFERLEALAGKKGTHRR